MGALSTTEAASPLVRGGCRRLLVLGGSRRRRRRRGVGGVLELLLLAEELVEHLVAQVLAHGQRDRAADHEEQELAPEAALALLRSSTLGSVAQRVAGVLQRGRCVGNAAVELL